jgi:hypothetical protein
MKYIKDTPICLIQQKQFDSPVWKDLLKISHIYLQGREFKLNNGKMVSFWLDSWMDNKPICIIYPVVYDLCTDKKVFSVGWAGWSSSGRSFPLASEISGII